MVNICLCRTSDASPVFSASLPFKKRKFNIQESTTSSTEDDNSEAIKQSTCDTQSVILNESAANIQESTTSSTEDGNGEKKFQDHDMEKDQVVVQVQVLI